MTAAEHHRIFERWISEHRGLVFKVVHASTATPDDRNDLFQEIAIQVWKSVPSFKGDSKASTWIFRVALNTAAVWSRKESLHRSRVESRENLEDVFTQGTGQRNDQLDWLYAEIRKLDPINRSLILLLLEGFSYQEIAGQLGITVSNVGVKLNRLKSHLSLKAEGIHHEP
jgi:RNA polymerase sigma-70 factor (ECF subfamily)